MPASAEQIARVSMRLGDVLASISTHAELAAGQIFDAIKGIVLDGWVEGITTAEMMASHGSSFGFELEALDKLFTDSLHRSIGGTLSMLESVTDPGDFWSAAPGMKNAGAIDRDFGIANMAASVDKSEYLADLRVIEAVSSFDPDGITPLKSLKQQFVNKVVGDVAELVTAGHMFAGETYASHVDSTARDERGRPPSGSSRRVFGHGIVGWRRVPEAGACLHCLLASTQRYHSQQLRPLHVRCRCTVAPIVGAKDPGQVINAKLRDAVYGALHAKKSAAPSDWYPAANAGLHEANPDLDEVASLLSRQSRQLQREALAKKSVDEIWQSMVSPNFSNVTGSGIAPNGKTTAAFHHARITELLDANPLPVPTAKELLAVTDPAAHAANVKARAVAAKHSAAKHATAGAAPSVPKHIPGLQPHELVNAPLTYENQLDRLRSVIKGDLNTGDLAGDVGGRLFDRALDVKMPTAAEIEAMAAYQTTTFYSSANKFFRLGAPTSGPELDLLKAGGLNPNTSFFRNVRNCDKALQKGALSEETVLYRGMQSWGSHGGKSDRDSFRDAWDSGDMKVHHPGYISTSFNPGVARGFASEDVLAIRAPAGTRGSLPQRHTSQFKSEQEWLLPRGGTFTIVDREEMMTPSGETWYIWHVDYSHGTEVWPAAKRGVK